MTQEEAIERIKSRYDKWALDDKDLEAIQCIFPELTESEDERIRKEIIGFFQDLNKDMFKYVDFGSWIAYLEKQRINTDGDFARGYDCGYECCLNSHGAEWLEKQKEQQPTVKQFGGTFNSYDMAKTFAEGQHYVMEHPEKFGLCKKPAEINEYEIIKKHITGDILSSEVNKRLKECGWYVTDEKPAEWSEDIIRKAVKEVGLTQHQIDWFKTNVFPPKQEWSEEDEKIYQTVFEHFNSYRKYTCSNGVKREHILSWLKSLRPRPHWTPSEEQMEAFRKYLEDFQARAEAAVGGWNNFDVMIRLYEQLKKLI